MKVVVDFKPPLLLSFLVFCPLVTWQTLLSELYSHCFVKCQSIYNLKSLTNVQYIWIPWVLSSGYLTNDRSKRDWYFSSPPLSVFNIRPCFAFCVSEENRLFPFVLLRYTLGQLFSAVQSISYARFHEENRISNYRWGKTFFSVHGMNTACLYKKS